MLFPAALPANVKVESKTSEMTPAGMPESVTEKASDGASDFPVMNDSRVISGVKRPLSCGPEQNSGQGIETYGNKV